MADENENENRVETAGGPAELIPDQISKFILEPLNHGIAASMRTALKQGVQAHAAIELLLNQLASVVALIEPAGAREQTIKDVISHFAPMTRKYVDMRNTTPGGVILPGGIKQ
jgi:hypothetical protein